MNPVVKPTKILRINLFTGKITSEEISQEWLKHFVGEKGLAAAYLSTELEIEIDALSPKNKLTFPIDPLVDITPACSRYCVVTKSPHTGTFLDSYFGGGHFPAQPRFSLTDDMGIIFEGKA